MFGTIDELMHNDLIDCVDLIDWWLAWLFDWLIDWFFKPNLEKTFYFQIFVICNMNMQSEIISSVCLSVWRYQRVWLHGLEIKVGYIPYWRYLLLISSISLSIIIDKSDNQSNKSINQPNNQMNNQPTIFTLLTKFAIKTRNMQFRTQDGVQCFTLCFNVII